MAGDPDLSRGKGGGDGGGGSLSKVEDFDPDTLERGTDRRGETQLLSGETDIHFADYQAGHPELE